MAAPEQKDSVTTHVLDQTTGLPAGGVSVTLTLHDKDLATAGIVERWHGITSAADGRISTWAQQNLSRPVTVHDYLTLSTRNKLQVGTLTFATEAYWTEQGKESFYPEIVLTFMLDPKDKRPHWHVPILMGPFGYTTYRGS